MNSQSENNKRSFWRRAHHPTRTATLLLIGLDVVALTTTSIALEWTPRNFVGFLILLLIALMGRGYYRTRMQTDLAEDASSIAVALAVAGAMAITYLAFDSTADPKLSTMVEVAFISFAVLLVSRALGYALLQRLRSRGHLRSRALLVGTGPIAREIAIELSQRPALGVDIVGHVSAQEGSSVAHHADLGPALGTIGDVSAIIDTAHCDRVIFSVPSEGNPAVVSAIRSLLPARAAVFVLPQLFELGLGIDSLAPDSARGYSLIRLGRSAHPQVALRLKRFFDIVLAAFLLIATAPLLVAIAVAVKVTSRGPILFKQERVGKDGKLFKLLKFRSMHVNSDSDTAWTPDLSSDGGLTRIGRLTPIEYETIMTPQAALAA